MNIAIIGGGASGLTAAIAAAKAGANVTIYEKLPRVGKKLLATGNGRCNISNISFDVRANYYSKSMHVAESVFRSFSPSKTRIFFEELGIIYREGDEGKLYPYSLQASAVLDVLRMEAARLKTEIICGCEITHINKAVGGFIFDDRVFDRLIIASGGRTAPSLGGGKSGYELLEAFGHRITPLFPSIVQVKTDIGPIKPLKGIKLDGVLTLMQNGDMLAQNTGEILFTEYGLSGPPVMHLSRLVSERYASGKTGGLFFSLDFLPEFEEAKVSAMLSQRVQMYPERLSEDLFVGLLPKRLGQTLVKSTGKSPVCPCADLVSEDIRLLAAAAKRFTVAVTGTLGFSQAQVTAGGADLGGFSETLESLHTPGLYACGEVLDVDGDCGGYNLQWAWSSGMAAGVNAAGGNLC